jgi:hypothetical protein
MSQWGNVIAWRSVLDGSPPHILSFVLKHHTFFQSAHSSTHQSVLLCTSDSQCALYRLCCAHTPAQLRLDTFQRPRSVSCTCREHHLPSALRPSCPACDNTTKSASSPAQPRPHRRIPQSRAWTETRCPRMSSHLLATSARHARRIACQNKDITMAQFSYHAQTAKIST